MREVAGEKRDEVNEQLGVTALRDLSECPCTDRMVLSYFTLVSLD